MSFQEKTRQAKFGIVGSVIFPLLYIVPLIVTKDPDFIVFALGPLGFIVWIVQWITFLIGGWIFTILATVLLFVLVGYLLGRLLGWLVNKITSRK